MLHRFAHALIEELLRRDLLEIDEGSHEEVCVMLRDRLATVETGSLIREVVHALTQCERVIELYADDETLIHLISDLGPGAARGG